MADNKTQTKIQTQGRTRPAGRAARFSYLPGHNIFKSDAQCLVNPVNCIGVSGALAGAFAANFPVMKRTYEAWCRWGWIRMGNPSMFYPPRAEDPGNDSADPLVLLFPTMQNPGSDAHLSDIVRGLEHFAKNYQEWGVTSIAFPALGCGVGGLLWSDVRTVIQVVLRDCDVDVEMYGPEHGELNLGTSMPAKHHRVDPLSLFPSDFGEGVGENEEG